MEPREFDTLVERHRRELSVHCYRMLGSYDDAEDLVQETFLRAWRHRDGFDGARPRPWLYRIATNACLDVLRTRPRRVTPPDVGPPADPEAPIPPPAELPWLQPFPDGLLDEDPATIVVARETVELAFLAAIQHVPPRQRAVLLLRTVIGASAKETAEQLEMSIASVNSALQRARTTLRAHMPAPSAPPSKHERELLRRYLDAHERADVAALGALLREDARLTMPPHAVWFDGRAAILTAVAPGFHPDFGHLRSVPIAANRQPGAAYYRLAPGDTEYRPLAMDVLTVRDGLIAEITSFVYPELFAAFGLPPTLR